MALEIQNNFFFFFFLVVQFRGHQTQMVVYTVFSHFDLGAFLSHYKKNLHVLTFPLDKHGRTSVSKVPYALSVKALWVTLGEEEKITCCKNTVNSTAECAEDKRKKKTCLLLVGAVILRHQAKADWLRRWPLVTFCVESSTVGLRGEGRERRGSPVGV